MTSSALSGASSPDVSGLLHVRHVVLIDTRADRRAITKQLLERSPLLAVVGTATTMEEADAEIRGQHPDVVLIEIQMPIPEGLATIATLHERFPDLRIVVSSFHNDRETRDAAFANHAAGYLVKPLEIDDLLALVGAKAAPEPAPQR